ncbi:MAG TPA: TIGR02266 family protein [Polyangia bacterium]
MAEQFRRTDPRYSRRIDVEVKGAGKQFAAQTRNLSLGGMFIETTELLPIQTTVELRFSLPAQPEPVEVTAEVRWVERGDGGVAAGMGVRFHGLRARDVWAFNRLFQTE